jgi:Ca2+-binding RTX toxin-like protein
MRPTESIAERGGEANYDPSLDPFYGANPRGSGVSIDAISHLNGLHPQAGAGHGAEGGFGAFTWNHAEANGPRVHAAEADKGSLASNFVLPNGSEIQDTGPGAGGDTIAGNSTTTQVLTIGAAAQTQYINSAADQDWFKVTLEAGHYYQFTMDPLNPVGENLDAVLEIRGGASGNILLGSSDGPGATDTEVLGFFAETSGTFFIKADGFQSTTGGYTISAVEAPLPEILDAIDWGGVTNVVPGADDNVIKVYFAGAGEDYGGGEGNSLGWNAYEIQQAMLAFQQYTNITGIQFEITSEKDEADFVMGTVNGSVAAGGVLGQMGPPGPQSSGPGIGTFWRDGFGWDEAGNGGLEQGGFGFVTLVHEIGHAMGMAHPHDNGGGSSVLLGVSGPFDDFGLFDLNQELFTIMSYNNAWDSGPNGATPGAVIAYGYMGTLGALDIAMMQEKYGANMSFHTGDDIYEIPSTNGVGTFFQTIWDAGGDDTIRYSGAANATINLNAATIDYSATGGGNPSYASGIYAAFSIAQGVMIERAVGGSGNDTLIGNAGSNVLQGRGGNDNLSGGDSGDTLLGGAGADALDGGAGLDYASYADATVGVGLNLTSGIHTGDALGDTFVNIERYRLSSFADTFIGSASGDYAYGNNGNDVLSGAGGVDKLYGQGDIDTLNGDAGNDILIGGAGADIFNGGADRDTASYEDMTQAVRLDLAGGTSTLDAIGDTFSSIEVFWLTAFNDTFIGSTGDDEVRGWDGLDTLNGGDGSDRLRGENGNDTLNGGEGDDFLWGDAGSDTLNGGNGTDTVSYTYARTSGVSINLVTNTHTGEAAGDTFTSVERFQLTNQSGLADSFNGSAGDDWVAGYKGADTLTGNDGRDTLNGGEHNDVLNGGAGNDKLIAGTGNDTMTGGADADQFWFNVGLFGHDTVTDFENGVDKIRITGQAGINDIGDLTIAQNGANVLITLPDGSTITLSNTSAGNIDASDFLWI